MFLQKVNSRKDIIANIIKSSQSQDFFTTFTSQSHWPFHSLQDRQTLQQPCRLLILDSSFNPPTKAHANLLTKALSSKPPHYFDASLLLFSTTNADKKLSGASVLQRAHMMELMAYPFQQQNIAVGFTPHAKFIDKAEAIQSWFKKSSAVELYFILGYDTIIRLFDPKYYSPVSVKDSLAPFFNNHCHLICADRGQRDDGVFWDRIHGEFHSQGNDLIARIQLDPDAATISSTLARYLLSSSLDNLEDRLNTVLDSNIIQYIRKKGLYDSEK